MANYFLRANDISRRNHSITKLISYISGTKLYDYDIDELFNNSKRSDVLYWNIFLPQGAPVEFTDIQIYCKEIDKAEKRYDARTAKEFIGSLPNELPFDECKAIVEEFIDINFTSCGLSAIAAIHEGANKKAPSRNNPHVHIFVSTRTVDSNGFNKKKCREINKRKYIFKWRESWADIQNRAYERNGLDIRVSHERLEAQGIDREPTNYLSVIDWHREKRGQRTEAGDLRREIVKRNKARSRQQKLERKRQYCRSR